MRASSILGSLKLTKGREMLGGSDLETEDDVSMCSSKAGHPRFLELRKTGWVSDDPERRALKDGSFSQHH
jgi:hypothetical protein